MMAVQLSIPSDRSPLSSDPALQINTFRGLLNILADSSVSHIDSFLDIYRHYLVDSCILKNLVDINQ